MNNITFLLGAGASANAIPLTLEIPLHLRFMADYIEKYSPSNKALQYVSDIRELLTHLSDFNTIDNYARVLSQNRRASNENELKKLKSILCGLFMFEQLKKKNEIVNQFSNVSEKEIKKMERTVDLRYKSLFAKILNGEKLDGRINIVSWNYDIQLEIGLESNLGYNYNELQNSCSIFPHPSCDTSATPSFLNQSQSPNIIKLNGTAGLFLKKDSFHNIYLDQTEFFEDRLDILMDVHQEVSRYFKYDPFLNFAWEKHDVSKKAINYAAQIMSRTNVLVVIGYSFPDFNRPVDNQVFSSNRISEVFLQLPPTDFETVKYNMRASLGNLTEKSKLNSNLTEFFLPSQFIPSY